MRKRMYILEVHHRFYLPRSVHLSCHCHVCPPVCQVGFVVVVLKHKHTCLYVRRSIFTKVAALPFFSICQGLTTCLEWQAWGEKEALAHSPGSISVRSLLWIINSPAMPSPSRLHHFCFPIALRKDRGGKGINFGHVIAPRAPLWKEHHHQSIRNLEGAPPMYQCLVMKAGSSSSSFLQGPPFFIYFLFTMQGEGGRWDGDSNDKERSRRTKAIVEETT